MASPESTAPFFTFHIFIEILSHLPVSSLKNFKFVCKQWHALITADPTFTTLHFNRGFMTSPPSIITLNLDFITLMDVDGRHKRNVFDISGLSISPSCNGLVCIYNSMDIIILNPTTLHKFHVTNPTKTNTKDVSCSIGYAAKEYKYKLVRFFRQRGDLFHMCCEVLTLGTSSWRQMSNCRPVVTGGVTVDGFMYWIVHSKFDGRAPDIISFNLDTEMFETVQFPGPSAELDSMYVLEGHVCVRVVLPDGIEIWMLESATDNGWIRKYVWRVDSGQPVVVHEGRFVVQSGRELWNCVPETGERIRKISRGKGFHRYAQVHTESLVSLPAP